jgi:cyclopropane fatty-acyl-phospholipid synthase-like methyltransferase
MSTLPRRTWTTHLKALWAGGTVAATAADVGALRVADGTAAWSLARVRLAERLWGEGFLEPVDAGTVLAMARPLGLAPTRRVLEVGSGLGGPARVLARATGATVQGVEADPVLADIGAARCRAANLACRAEVRAFDPERAVFDGGYDAAIVRGALLGVSRKNELIEAIAGAVEPAAPVLIVAFVLRHSGQLAGLVEEWRQAEPGPVHPWALTQLVDRLKSRGFALRGREDVSESYADAARAGWRRFQAALPELEMDEALRTALFRESGLWAKRLAALDAGELQIYRLLADAPA